MNPETGNIISGIRQSFGINLPDVVTLDQLKSSLAVYINSLINTDFNKLVSLLYRIDVNEVKLRQLLDNNRESDAAAIITDLIIERQLQKIRSREHFRRTGENSINDDEKW
jgi:hypothetical protein